MTLPSGELGKNYQHRVGVSVSEPKFTSDGFKLAFRHELPQRIGAWICLLIKGDDTQKILPIPSISGGH